MFILFSSLQEHALRNWSLQNCRLSLDFNSTLKTKVSSPQAQCLPQLNFDVNCSTSVAFEAKGYSLSTSVSKIDPPNTGSGATFAGRSYLSFGKDLVVTQLLVVVEASD